jgi:hypothetical protein
LLQGIIRLQSQISGEDIRDRWGGAAVPIPSIPEPGLAGGI